MKITQTTAIQLITALHRPRFHGPGLKSGLMRRRKTGMT